MLPFLGILTAPERAFRHLVVFKLVELWGITSPKQLVLPLSLSFAVAVLVAGATRILILWVRTRFTSSNGGNIDIEGYRRTKYPDLMKGGASTSFMG